MSNIIDSDLFVIQRQTGQVGTYKVRADDLASYVGTSTEAIVYEGQRDFTKIVDDPHPGSAQPKPIDPLNKGTMLMNIGQSGTWAWQNLDPDLVADNLGGVPVEYGDRCIWDGVYWELIKSSGGGNGTLTAIKGTEPIVIDDSINGSAEEPIVEIKPAQKTDNSSNIDKLALAGTGGAVVGLATEADVSEGGGNDFAVVTADLLRATNERLDDIVDPDTGYVSSVDKGTATAATTGTGNTALTITPSKGDVKLDITKISDTNQTQLGVTSYQEIEDIISSKAVDSNGELVASVTAATNDSSAQALNISPTTGNVIVEVKAATQNTMGVVSISDIEDVIDEYAKDGNVVGSLVEGDDYTGYQTALQFPSFTIKPADPATGVVEINIKSETYLPYNFKDLADLPAAP